MLIIVRAQVCVCVFVYVRVYTRVNSCDFVLSMYMYVCVLPGRIRFGFRGEKGKRRMEEFSYEAHK